MQIYLFCVCVCAKKSPTMQCFIVTPERTRVNYNFTALFLLVVTQNDESQVCLKYQFAVYTRWEFSFFLSFAVA